MKEIKAIIQPFMLSKVEEALCKIPDFPGMTITKVFRVLEAKNVKKASVTGQRRNSWTMYQRSNLRL